MLDPLAWTLPSERAGAWIEQAAQLAALFRERAAAHDAAASFAFENFADLARADLHRLPVPVEFGGWGASMAEALRVVEQIAQGDGATALIYAMHLQVLGGANESRPWQPDRFAALCHDVITTGSWVNATATEPELGSPSHGGLPATTARWTGDGWRVTGRKSWSTGAPILGHFLAPAVLERDDLPSGTVGIFDVRRDRPGVRIEETWNVIGMRTTGSHDLVLEDVPLGVADLLVERAPGAVDAGRVSSGAWFGVMVGGVYLGIAQAARDVAIRFAQTRTPTALAGKSIASLEVIQQRLGALETKLLTARSLVYSIAETWQRFPEQRPALGAHIGLCKVVATTHAVEATDLALRIVGGTAMERNFPLERLFRDVRAGIFHPPAEETGYTRLGAALLV